MHPAAAGACITGITFHLPSYIVSVKLLLHIVLGNVIDSLSNGIVLEMVISL